MESYLPLYDVGTQVDTVVTMVCFDATEQNHLVSCMVTKKLLRLKGAIPKSHTLTIFDATVEQGGQTPVLSILATTRVLPHVPCEWADLYNVVSACAGLGAMEHGIQAAGFQIIAAIDQNPHMTRMHEKVHGVHVIQGDISAKDTLVSLWTHHSRPCIPTAGIACQPYSQLGDRMEGLDARAQSLPGTLKCAFYLQYPVVVIECVLQASESAWVNEQVRAFCRLTGFRRSEQTLDLHDVLPCRRTRWWLVLTSPVLGEVPIRILPNEFAVMQIKNIMPMVIDWIDEDEDALRLNEEELNAFSAHNGGPYMMNMNSSLPCPLHSWGSQLRPCPCECRQAGLSSERLRTRGLLGVVVRSKHGHMRHIHPGEVSAVAGVDPNLHHDDDPRLVLAGIGQMASPIHSVWVFATIAHRIAVARTGSSSVSPTKELLAYVSWFLLRCKVLWPDQKHIQHDVASRIDQWKPLQLFPQKQLQNLEIWDAALPRSLASLLQQIQDASADSDLDRFLMRELRLMEPIPEPVADIPDTVPFTVEVSDECMIVVQSLMEPNAVGCQVRVTGDAQLQHVIRAEQTLQNLGPDDLRVTGDVDPAMVLRDGMEITMDFRSTPLPDDDPMTDTSNEPPEHPAGHMSVVQATSTGVQVNENSPLLGLSADMLVRLRSPVITRDDELPALYSQALTVEERKNILANQGHVMANDEVLWFLRQMLTEHTLRVTANDVVNRPFCHSHVAVVDPMIMKGWGTGDLSDLPAWCQAHCNAETCVVAISPCDGHWTPLVMWQHQGKLHAHTWDTPSANHQGIDCIVQAFTDALGLQGPHCHRLHRLFLSDRYCGALAVGFIQSHILLTTCPETDVQAYALHDELRTRFMTVLDCFDTCVKPWVWCSGVPEAVQGLIPLLIEQGVHGPEAESRAQAAVKVIGAKQVQQALELKHPWKQLKSLGNLAKFQFLLPSELEAKIAYGAGRKIKGKKSKTPMETDFQLDPSKLGLATGCFQSGGVAIQQLSLGQLGPLAEGVVIVNVTDAEPYIKAGQLISKCPLALVVISGSALSRNCSLPHANVTVPCRCNLNQEPLLVDALLVQIGTGMVEKTLDKGLVKEDAMEVATLKVMVYRDEVSDWEAFIQAPMKYVVGSIPLFTRCDTEGCKCPKWHPPINVDAKNLLLDVWRRQHLRPGFKAEQPRQAQIFTACIRVPKELMTLLLTQSGVGGIYFEPRSADAKAVDTSFSIVWTPKTTKAELHRLRHTVAFATSIARVGGRYGLRCEAGLAAQLHAAVRPDSIFLAAGPRQQYLAGPMPFGSDRASLTRAFKALHWDVKPLQPVSSVAGRGSMWLVVAVTEPPQNMFQLEHGEIVITKHKLQDRVEKPDLPKPVASAATIQLVGKTKAVTKETDPWQTGTDPWKHYVPQAADPTAALQAFESKIEQSVLAKVPNAPADDGRITTLETQVHQLIQSQAQLKGHVQEAEQRQQNQLTHMQTELQRQGQQLTGALHSQEQTMQAMFEKQFAQIRGLLKRSRGDDEDDDMS
eukprot:Skav230265  [mRNA]  locus=scaffold3387:213214:217764:+ [translate_table: standard]